MEGATLCLGGNSASALTPPIPDSLPLRVSQVSAPPPEMLQTTSTGYLKGLLGKAMWFPSFGRPPRNPLLRIKPGLLLGLIWPALIYCIGGVARCWGIVLLSILSTVPPFEPVEEQVCIAPAGLAQMWEFFTLVCTPTAPKYLRASRQESEQLKMVIRSVKYDKRYWGRLVDESPGSYTETLQL